jgi:hypothetical protein
MFQMMNQARINTGVSGMTIASTAYQNALSYARERIQGSDLAGRKSSNVPIIDHPDVRRMLLWMKAMVDGMRSMIYTGAFWSDLGHESEGDEKREHYQALEDFTTPIIKAYCSDMGFSVCETAIQCLGGYGYCKEYPVEQYLRDIKIMSLYEGTNGIQAIDLMGRKMRIRQGAPFKAFMSELLDFCRNNEDHTLFGNQVQALARVAEKMADVSKAMLHRADSDPLQWASYTYPALICFGDLMAVWRLLDMGIIAHRRVENEGENDFFVGKIKQASYFADITLPMVLSRMETCLREGREIVEMPVDAF